MRKTCMEQITYYKDVNLLNLLDILLSYSIINALEITHSEVNLHFETTPPLPRLKFLSSTR